MSRLSVNHKLETIVSLDTKTKELIVEIENISKGINNTKSCREKLDCYQTRIRENLVTINSILDELQTFGRGTNISSTNRTLYEAIVQNKKQLFTLQDQYRKAIFAANSTLETVEKAELTNRSSRTEVGYKISNLEEQYQNSLELTQDMTRYARLLAEEVQRGAVNAELLENSSNKLISNYSELKEMAGHMNQSKHLTSLARRRRFTERVLFFLAFSFFFLSCGTIFLHRIPMGHWFLPFSY
ncbi:Vesicle transport protein S20 [Schistosoma haematobium]|uniref:Vesicle transport protein S20 n=2 Tax=Schistosoma haematobium TaxID=6185 RepID=A0A922IM05_SCHHA|nr:Vesicle transport protein S20 [Schistosoma haematobium]KAH9582716.1 Vesicle transport protein S20 [Schistosoma haematobium]